jgi:hypothetical protein
MTAEALSDEAIRRLAEDWYRKLDVHAPFEELVPMVVPEGLEMLWPEGPTHGIDGFKGWYDRVTRVFFDEVHTVKSVDVARRGDEAEVKVVVNWQAKVWNPPEPNSKWLGMDARQTWVVRPSEDGQRPVIARYVVDGLDLMEGSASL